MLKCILETLDGLSETEAAHYVKKGDKFELQLEGAKTQGDLDRVQKALNDERNITKELKAQLSEFDGLKAPEVRAALSRIPELETLAEAGGKKLDKDAVDVIVKSKVAAETLEVRTNWEKEKQEHAKTAARVKEFEARERSQTMHGAMRELAVASKANPDAFSTSLGSLMLLTDAICDVDPAGQVVIKEGAKIADVEPGTLLKDALAALQKQYPSCWPSSNGGGAPGSGNSGGSGGKNVFKENNLTVRSQLLRDNPAEAERQFKASGLDTYFQEYKAKK